MNDEGIGIAGWLLADLTLVLALIFLALVPGRPAAQATPEPRVEPPVIADIGCRPPVEAMPAMPVVTCEPTVEGEGTLTYEWEVGGGGERESARDAATLKAAFAGAGWVRLLVSNEGGETDERYPVIPPTPTPDPGKPQADFNFDQLVLSSIGSDHSTDALASVIAEAGVRADLSKSDEDKKKPDTAGTGEEWLLDKQQKCWRIALVETFSRPLDTGSDNRIQMGLELSKAVNDALFEYLSRSENGPLPNRGIFYGGLEEVQSKKSAFYYSSFNNREAGERESRINLFFVLDPACDPSP